MTAVFIKKNTILGGKRGFNYFLNWHWMHMNQNDLFELARLNNPAVKQRNPATPPEAMSISNCAKTQRDELIDM